MTKGGGGGGKHTEKFHRHQGSFSKLIFALNAEIFIGTGEKKKKNKQPPSKQTNKLHKETKPFTCTPKLEYLETGYIDAKRRKCYKD